MKVLLYPSYFPAISSMVVMSQASEVVFEVEDNYQKQSFRNRTNIAHSNGKLQLNIPIKHSKGQRHQKTKDVTPENETPWLQHHWKSFQSAYRTSPYFEYYEDDIAPLFHKKVTNLLAFNLQIIDTLTQLIGINTPTTKSKEYHKNPDIVDARNLIIAKGATNFNFDTYHQVFESAHGHIPNLSVVDLLFNEGPNTLNYLENQTLPIKLL